MDLWFEASVLRDSKLGAFRLASVAGFRVADLGVRELS